MRGALPVMACDVQYHSVSAARGYLKFARSTGRGLRLTPSLPTPGITMGNPMCILIMAMAVASGNAFIVSPKAQLAARRTLPHARAMPIVAAYSKIEDEAKDTEVCPHACVMSHLAYGPREPVDLPPPPSPPAPPCPIPSPSRVRGPFLSPSPHDTTVDAFTAHPQLSPLLPAQCSRLCPRRQSKL